MHFSFFKKEQTNRLWSVSQRDAEHIANVITKGKYEWIEYIYIYIYIYHVTENIFERLKDDWIQRRWMNINKIRLNTYSN